MKSYRTITFLLVIAVCLIGSILAARHGVVAEPDNNPTAIVSRSAGGAQGNGRSTEASVSATGRFIAFTSIASNLVNGDTNGYADVFVFDRQTETTELISVGVGGDADGNSGMPSISADGRYVAFASNAGNLTASSDTNMAWDIFVRDRQNGTTRRVSVSSTGAQGNGDSLAPSISADGQFVAFESVATNLVSGDSNRAWDIFVYSLAAGTIQRVSVNSSGAQSTLDRDSLAPSISGDGRYIAFQSDATNLVSGDTNAFADIFVHDRQTAQTRRVSVSSGGAQGNADSLKPSISADGQLVAFDSYATNLVTKDNNSTHDVFVHDLSNGQTRRVSVSSFGVQAEGDSHSPAMSAGGRYVAFMSYAPNLVTGDNNRTWDIFIHDRQTGETQLVSRGADEPVNDVAERAALSANGEVVAFDSPATNLGSGETNDTYDVFARRLESLPPPSLPAAENLAATVVPPAQVDLVWVDASSDESGFRIERSPNGNDDWSEIGVVWPNTTTFSHTGLTCGSVHHYRVIAFRSIDNTVAAPSNVASATLPSCNQPPAAPSAPLPKDADTGVAVTAALSWAGSDPDNDPLTFNVFFGTSNPPPPVASGQSATSYDPPGDLAYSTTYYWQVLASDGKGGETTGPIWSFTTGGPPNTPPSAPGNASPPNNATNVAVSAAVAWSASDPDGDALVYDVSFGTANPPPQVAVGQTTTSYDPPGDLAIATTYYWSIVARDGRGGSTAGPVWRFTTQGIAPTWTSANVGSGSGGTTTETTTQVTMIADGGDIAGSADSFRYAYRTCANDTALLGRITAWDPAGLSGAKAGLMLRSDTNTGAPHISLYIAGPSRAVALRYRTASGGDSTTVAGPASATLPLWLKLERRSNAVSALYSADGVQWTQVGSSITMSNLSANALCGMAVTSTSTGTSVQATYDNVRTLSLPVITSFTPSSGAPGTSVTINGTNLSGVTGVRFNNTPATGFTIVSATQVTAVVPAGATTGKIAVTTPDGTAVSAANFTVPVASTPDLYFSPKATVGNYAHNDVLAWYRSPTSLAIDFDASAIPGQTIAKNVFAFARLSDGDYLITFKGNQSIRINGVANTFEAYDVARYDIATQTWSWYLDGRDAPVGLSTSAETIDALAVTPDGRPVVSITGTGAVPCQVGTAGCSSAGVLTVHDEDLIVWNGTIGADPTGKWAMYCDVTLVPGLGGNAQDVVGASISGNGTIYLSLLSNYSRNGVTYTPKDIFTLSSCSASGVPSRFWRTADGPFSGAFDAFEVKP